jgi:hypothetical protein
MIKKADVILAIILMIAGIASTLYLVSGGVIGETVIVSVNGQNYGTYDLTQNQILDVAKNGHINKVEIKDGKVTMIDADCPDKLCIKQGSIDKTNQSIVCLPNKVVVELDGPSVNGPDTYSN